MDSARQSWNSELQIMRTASGCKKSNYTGPDQEVIKEWRELQYKPFHKEVAQYSGFTGFYSDVDGKNLFIALMEYLGKHYQTEAFVDNSYWKISFTLTVPRPEIEDSDGEHEEVVLQQVEVTSTVRVVTPGIGKSSPPKKVFMQFRRESGCPILFGNFMTHVMANKLNMFVI